MKPAKFIILFALTSASIASASGPPSSGTGGSPLASQNPPRPSPPGMSVTTTPSFQTTSQPPPQPPDNPQKQQQIQKALKFRKHLITDLKKEIVELAEKTKKSAQEIIDLLPTAPLERLICSQKVLGRSKNSAPY